MEQRDSFIFYRSFYEALRQCPDDVRLSLYDAIADYALNFKTPELGGVGAALWTLIEPQLKANNNRYLNGKKGSQYGVMGGAPKGNTNAKRNQTTTKPQPKQPQNNPKTTPNENENVNVNENDNVNESKSVAKQPKRTRTRKANEFNPPTIEEVQAYVIEKGYTFNPAAFMAHYESNGWKVGRNPMVSWKAACTNWQTRENDPKTITIKQGGNNNGRNEHPNDEQLIRQTYEIIADADGKAEAGYYDSARLPF